MLSFENAENAEKIIILSLSSVKYVHQIWKMY